MSTNTARLAAPNYIDPTISSLMHAMMLIYT
jgi:hypothetical protein